MTDVDAPQPEKARTPLYPRLLRLRHIAPNAWQRALLGEGALALAVLLVLADLATAWTLLVLPVAVAVVVKAHDALAGRLETPSGAAASAAVPSATATDLLAGDQRAENRGSGSGERG